ncbi:hypothetical protein GCM10011608_59830 [Micromonospora sonchi]|uniref:Uncharacterized protein n=1 Tax=Micromonospora sonchi TaxID=1763543 RepID=A0A917U8M7_9ACTN|nr:hypothetical protein GCM10011608_59830 [Micromonospora sonchi]
MAWRLPRLRLRRWTPSEGPSVAAAITTRVFDRSTGEPVKGVCVLVMPALTFRLPNTCPTRSGGGGRATLRVPEPGQYNLLALPKHSETPVVVRRNRGSQVSIS